MFDTTGHQHVTLSEGTLPMMGWVKKHPTKSAFLFICLISVIKFWEYSSSFVLGEPDTVIHIELVENLYSTLRPVYQGQGWYFGLPLYFYLSFLVSLIVKDINLSLVLVSILSSIVFNLAVYWYISRKVNPTAGIITALVFFLSPSLIFYSRIGLIEMTVLAFSFIFLFLFDIGVGEKSLRKVLLSGVALGLALFTKYTSLIFVMTPGVFVVVEALKNITKVKSWIQPIMYSIYTWVIAVLIPLPIVAYFLVVDRWRFKLLTQATLLESKEFWGRGGFNWFFSEYSSMMPLLVGSVVLVLSIFGLVFISNKKIKSWLLFLITFLIALFFVFKRNPSPRYFVVLTPFFSILAGLGLYYVYTLARKFNNFASIIVVILGLSLMIPEFQYAFWSNSHQSTVNQVADFIKERGGEGKPVFTTFWPNLFRYGGTGQKTSWLTGSAYDVGAFGSGWSVGKNSVQILKEEGGFAIIEERYTNILWRDMDSVGVVTSDVRREPVTLIEANYKPVKVIVDTSPNFPFFANTYTNTFKIYEIRN